MYCISFNFSTFLYNLHDLPQKKSYMCLPQKKNHFFIIYTTYRKIKYSHLPQKNLHDLTIFLCKSYIFHCPLSPLLKQIFHKNQKLKEGHKLAF